MTAFTTFPKPLVHLVVWCCLAVIKFLFKLFVAICAIYVSVVSCFILLSLFILRFIKDENKILTVAALPPFVLL